MNALPVWIVSRPLPKGKSKMVAAYFTLGMARQSCIPNFKEVVTEGWLVTGIDKSQKGLSTNDFRFSKGQTQYGDCCNLPSRKPAKKSFGQGMIDDLKELSRKLKAGKRIKCRTAGGKATYLKARKLSLMKAVAARKGVKRGKK